MSHLAPCNAQHPSDPRYRCTRPRHDDGQHRYLQEWITVEWSDVVLPSTCNRCDSDLAVPGTSLCEACTTLVEESARRGPLDIVKLAEGCCGNAEWRGRYCGHHSGMEEGIDLVVDEVRAFCDPDGTHADETLTNTIWEYARAQVGEDRERILADMDRLGFPAVRGAHGLGEEILWRLEAMVKRAAACPFTEENGAPCTNVPDGGGVCEAHRRRYCVVDEPPRGPLPDGFQMAALDDRPMCGGKGPAFCRKHNTCLRHNACSYMGGGR